MGVDCQDAAMRSEMEFLQIRRAGQETRPSIERLLDTYLHELAGHREIAEGAEDAASYPYLKLYWEEDDRFPFIFKRDDRIAGFALVRRITDEAQPSIQMAEFYVTPAYRRNGIGSKAVHEIWQEFPGHWELQVHKLKCGAVQFWERCVREHAEPNWRVDKVAANDGTRLQFSFDIT